MASTQPADGGLAERATDVEHIRKAIAASALIGVHVVTTFVGRDPARSIEDQWSDFEDIWRPIIAFAEQQGVKVGIDSCPMLFSLDEWRVARTRRFRRRYGDGCSRRFRATGGA